MKDYERYFEEPGDMGYLRLATKMLKVAVYDYKDCLRRIKYGHIGLDTMDKKRSLETFFHSQMFGLILDMDSDEFIERVKEQIK